MKPITIAAGRAVVALFGVMLVAPAGAVHATSRSPRILDLARGAAGGDIAVAAVRSLHVTLSVTRFGSLANPADTTARTFKVAIWLGSPDRFLYRTGAFDTVQSTGVDGDRLIVPRRLPLPAAMQLLKTNRTEMNRLGLAWMVTPFTARVTDDGPFSFGNSTYDAVMVSDVGYRFRLGYDKRNHRLAVLQDLSLTRHAAFERFGDYRRAGSLTIPFEREIHVDGRLAERWETESVEINPPNLNDIMTRYYRTSR